MKLTVIRQIDKLGRICIPMDFRRSLIGKAKEAYVSISVTENGILLREVTGTDARKKKSDAKESGMLS